MKSAQPPPEEASRRSRLNIIAGGILAAFLAALDTTALATVMPTIAEELGGLHLYSWVFAGYMILSAVSMPLWGKLADIYGKRRLFFGTVGIFVLASVLCGLSGSIYQLIVFRAIQGIGAGGLASIPFAIVSTAFPPHERGKALGAIASAWGVSSVLGPIIGSTIVLSLDWRWVFFVNVPVGSAAVAVVAYSYHEVRGRPSERVDFLGAAFLCSAIVAFLLALRAEEGVMAGWRPTLGGTALLSALLFLWRETRAADPILHLGFFRSRAFSLSNLLGFTASFAMFGIIAYIPLFAQITQGGSAMEAGAIITPMSLSWSLAAVASGRLAHRLGESNLIRFGIVMMILGMLLARMASPDTPLWHLILVVVAAGVGMGAQTPSLMLTVQQSVNQASVGVATSTQMLFRALGGALGVTITGAVMITSMSRALAGDLSGSLPGGVSLREILEPGLMNTLTPEVRHSMLGVLSSALGDGFTLGLAVVSISLLLSLLIPRTPRPAAT